MTMISMILLVSLFTVVVHAFTTTTNIFRIPNNIRTNRKTEFLLVRQGSEGVVVTKKKKKKKNTNNRRKTEPWRASYWMSCQTQTKLKDASRSFDLRRTTPQQRMERILQLLLEETPPEKCNPANLVCALTISAKIISSSPNYNNNNNNDNKFTKSSRYWLYRAMDVLNQLVVKKKALNSRQLCNAIYAIAKLYNFDSTLLPSPPERTALSETDDSSLLESKQRKQQMGIAEEWIIKGTQLSFSSTEQKQLKSTVDMIALQLTDLLLVASDVVNSTKVQGKNNKPPRVGEASMACWAYGTLKQRKKPPGWIMPPQLSRLPKQKQQQQQQQEDDNNTEDTFTFEQWVDIAQKNDTVSSFYNDDDNDDNEICEVSPVTQFFDAVATYLCSYAPVTTDNNGNDNKNHITMTQSLLVEEMSWNEIANVAWAFASHGHCRTEQSEHLMATLANEAALRLQKEAIAVAKNEKIGIAPSFLSRDISQLVWSIGTLQSDNFRLSESLASFVDSIALYWLGTTQKLIDSESDTLTNERNRPFLDWSNTDLVQLAISLGHGRMDHQVLLTALFQEATYRLEYNSRRCFQEWEVSVLLWVQARLYLKDGSYEQFTKTAVRWLRQRSLSASASSAFPLQQIGIRDQEKANLAWSLTVLEAYEDNDPDTIALLRQIFQEAAAGNTATSKNSIVQLEHAHQLWQALFLIEYECPQILLVDGESIVPDCFRSFLRDKWNIEKARLKISSFRHRALSETLELMGIAHYNEHDEDIDVAIVLKEDASWTSQVSSSMRDTTNNNQWSSNTNNNKKKTEEEERQFKVAIEFDGPLHFTRESSYYDASTGQEVVVPQRTLGHTVLKYRLLKRQGWAVVRVPYYEFDKIPFWASMERQRYLQRMLKTHSNLRFSANDVSEYKPIVRGSKDKSSRFD